VDSLLFVAFCREYQMLQRLITAVAVGATLLIAAGEASAQLDEKQMMLTGGAPKGREYNFFGLTGSELSRTTVNFPGQHQAGTIVINTAERRLYLVQDGGTALRYAIGVGRIGFTWKGVRKVTEKKEWPAWTPPPQMLQRRPDLPRHMAGGIDNPLGARAMYLGGTLYRIHGSNEPETIGQAVSSGCFRLTNDDVKDLYDRVKVGATVIVQ
jgi:lipoprotein-anchoring transpeptidase ErfK/SrfK